MVGIQRVQKEGTVTALPQRSDHLLGEELRPVGLGLVDQTASPVLVLPFDPRGGNLGGIVTRGLHFAQRHISRQAGVREDGQLGVGYMAGVHDHQVEGL